MKTGKRANVLLLELLIVIFFFMIGSTILMQVFEKSHKLSERAEHTAVALSEAQNVADQLYTAEDQEMRLEALGFRVDQGAGGDPGTSFTQWIRETPAYTLLVRVGRTVMEGGTFRETVVKVMLDGEEAASLPCSRYMEGGA